MERKLVKTGGHTFTVSLPISWVGQNKLQKKDAVYIVEKNNQLIISCKEIVTPAVQSVISCDKKSLTVLQEEAAQQFQSGASSITFLLRAPEDIQRIEQIMSKFAGFELYVQEKEKVVYRDMFANELIEVEQLLRKEDAFLRLMCKEIIEKITQTQQRITIASTASYLQSLQRQNLLLNRKLLRRDQLHRQEVAALLISRALLKIGTLIRDFIGTMNLLDAEQIQDMVVPEWEEYAQSYEKTIAFVFKHDVAGSIRKRERLLMRTEAMKAKIRSSQEPVMILIFESFLALYWELIHISELVWMVVDE